MQAVLHALRAEGVRTALDDFGTGFVQLAHTLQLKTTAEGVETRAQHAALRAFGCTYGQGYLYARPLDGDGTLRFIAQWRGLPGGAGAPGGRTTTRTRRLPEAPAPNPLPPAQPQGERAITYTGWGPPAEKV